MNMGKLRMGHLVEAGLWLTLCLFLYIYSFEFDRDIEITSSARRRGHAPSFC